MTVDEARRFAQRAHAGSADRYGEPILDHVGRVAATVPPQARVVAWLHEILECTSLSADDLRTAGAAEDEIAAVGLLRRSADVGAEDPSAEYEAHILRISEAPGRAGELARIVKRADLGDRLEHRDDSGFSTLARPAYRHALKILDAAG